MKSTTLVKQDYPKEPQFENDWREENPKLHLLYVKTAIFHLTEAYKMLMKLYSYSDINTLDLAGSLEGGVDKLCKGNAAYWEAREMLKSINVPSKTFWRERNDR